jgi:transcriptional regulator with GAF, ATPase, and Fis domain
MWSEAREDFNDHEVAIIEGIADQIGTALERDQLSAEVMRLRSALHERHAEDRIIGQAPAIRRAIELALNVAGTQTSVLIQGESGTGKELLANLIHFNSGREDRPYIKLNCGAVAKDLAESELFGHEKGSFTGALASRKGRFELADGGTLFLDEIGDISPRTQVALLRVLQDKTFERVGGVTPIRVNVRVVCATHRDLKAMVARGEFREDLYFRLRGVVLEVPALRHRISDLPLIGRFFSQTDSREVKSDLLIMITPTIIDEGEAVRPPGSGK